MSARRAITTGARAVAMLAICLALSGVILPKHASAENTPNQTLTDRHAHLDILNDKVSAARSVRVVPQRRGDRHSPEQTGLSLSCMALPTVTGKRASCGKPPRR